MFAKVPKSSLGILKVPHLPPLLEQPPLKNLTNFSCHGISGLQKDILESLKINNEAVLLVGWCWRPCTTPRSILIQSSHGGISWITSRNFNKQDQKTPKKLKIAHWKVVVGRQSFPFGFRPILRSYVKLPRSRWNNRWMVHHVEWWWSRSSEKQRSPTKRTCRSKGPTMTSRLRATRRPTSGFWNSTRRPNRMSRS